MGTFDDFNFSASGSKKQFSKKRKIALACGISAAVIAVILILLLGLRTCKNQSGSSADTRQNTLELVKMYMERGQYDRALDKLDELLIQDRNDADALSLLNEVLTAKGEKTSGGNSNIRVEVDTKSLTNAVQSSIESMKSELAANNKTAEENRKAMEDLIKDRQERNAQEKALQEEAKAQQKALQEEAKAQQKALEEQRKKEEIARKAAEEELAKKNEKLKKEVAAVNDGIQQGKTALKSGNINGALEYFMNAEKKLPVSGGEPAFSSSKYSEIASLLYDASENASSPDEKKKLHDKAVEYAQKSVAANPKDAPSQFILGMDSLDKKDYAKALDFLQKAAAADNRNYVYFYNLGRVQYMMKKYTEAKYSFSTTSRINGSFAPSRYNLGLTNLRLGEQRAALEDFRKAHDIDPRHERAYLEEGRLLSQMKDYAGAVNAYQNVVRINNTNRAALQELGSVYYQMEKYTDAENAFRQSLALLPAGTEDPLTFYNLSTVLYAQNKNDQALSYAKRSYDSKSSLKDKNGQVNVIYNYALLSEKTGNTDEAISKYAEVLRVNPNHVKTQINLGVMYMAMNPPDADRALSLFLSAYSQEKNNFEVNNNLGSAYLTKKDYTNAILYFQNALRMEPKNTEVRSNLAQAFAGAGQYDNAKTSYVELLKQSPSDWNAYVELGKVCMALNDNAGAEAYLTAVQSKQPQFRKDEVSALLSSIRGGEAK